MELRDLGYFEALASELNFGRAARSLHMTQPALSLAIARLEKQVGCALFRRSPQGVSLTPAGAVLLAETKTVINRVERARDLACRAGTGDLGSLVVGFLDSAVFDVLPAMLAAFRDRYPGVDLTLHQRKSSDLLTGVEKGVLDVALIRPDVRRRGVEIKRLYGEPAVVAVSTSHRFAHRTSLHLKEIVDESFVFPEMEVAPALYSTWIDMCRTVRFSPRIVASVSSAQIFVELIAQEVGIGFAARSWLRREDRVVGIPLDDAQLSLEMAIAYRSDGISPACKNFIRLAVAQADPGVVAAEVA
jgi:DNA-binding transcriptional LysR family regulator